VHISLQVFVLLVQACVVQSCDAYWLPTPFASFPFTSPPVRHRVPSHFNWTLQTNSYCSPEPSICALGDLTISKLDHTASLLDCQRPTLVVSTNISFISLFIVSGGKFACARLLSFTVCYIINTFRDQPNTLYCPLSAAYRVPHSKISVAIPS
jgi:hypothetical protein